MTPPPNAGHTHDPWQAPPANDPSARWLNDLMTEAVQRRASDIHLEPTPGGLTVRLRIDGRLKPLPAPDPLWRDRVLARFKVLARMDIAEKRLPQDGRAQWRLADRWVNLRVSSLPTVQGEKMVLRLLPGVQRPPELSSLGYTPTQLAGLTSALRSPHGLVLVTGPTGSGKSATLMACLGSLDAQALNITTVEDPVEQLLADVNQVSVNDKIGFDFPTALRALLRQDPDVLMVGEIRDLPTALVASQAAQTGHLVLSTLHTNTAASAVVRLRHMGVPADHLAACLRLVMAQRLVRLLCPHCKRTSATGECGPVGCAHCQDGYVGRQAIHEVVAFTPAMLELVVADAGVLALEQAARAQGTTALRDQGLALVAQGLTTRAEVERVCAADADGLS